MALKPGYLKWKLSRDITATATVAYAAANTADSAVQQAESLAAASGAANGPTIELSNRYSFWLVTLACSTSGATINYQINGGGYGTYSSPFTADYGDTLDTYASKAGLTDSGIVSVSL